MHKKSFNNFIFKIFYYKFYNNFKGINLFFIIYEKFKGGRIISLLYFLYISYYYLKQLSKI
jgi:hypothetical protein